MARRLSMTRAHKRPRADPQNQSQTNLQPLDMTSPLAGFASKQEEQKTEGIRKRMHRKKMEVIQRRMSMAQQPVA